MFSYSADFNVAKDFFQQSETWKDANDPRWFSRAYFLYENDLTVSGCCVFEFDGVCIIYHLFTLPLYRNKGYATQVIQYVVENNPSLFVIARTNDLTVKLFTSAGFEVLYTNSLGHYIVGAGGEE